MIVDKCVVCGIIKPIKANNKCIECYMKDYKEKNRLRVNERARIRYHTNPNYKKYQKNYYKAYYIKNKLKFRKLDRKFKLKK